MDVTLKPRSSIGLFGLAVIVLLTCAARATPHAAQTADVDRALGKWNSIERFEGEPRIAVAFRRSARSIEGWAVLLGQHRKNDDRATLGLSFTDATWNGRSVQFSTILPEDEGTIGWELQVLNPTKAMLVALTENGQPIQDDLKWEMTR